MAIHLIAGLGNPGKEYAATRHNAGAWLVETLAHANDLVLKQQTKFHGLYSPFTDGNQHGHLLIPTTFMNLSGQSVSACLKYHKLTPDQLVVAHDELDLPVGVVRLKFDGGDGGHNGVGDIIRHLKTKQFYRLRIGIGHPGKSHEVHDYVLKKPSKADKEKIEDAVARAIAVLPLIMAGEIQKAMQELHTRDN